MTYLYIDFETRSRVGLRAVGLAAYAADPSTEIQCMAWALGDEDPRVWAPGTVWPSAVGEHVALGRPVVAHNAAFELALWNGPGIRRHGLPRLFPSQTVCTMAAANAMALPSSLEDAAVALGLPLHKDVEGRALMLKMARPRKDGSWLDDEASRARLYAYCQQDVRVEREIHKRVFPLSAAERRVWEADQAINARGVQVDAGTVRAAQAVIAQTRQKIDAALAEITGGAVLSVTAIAAIKEWLAGQGVVLSGLTKQHIAEALSGELPPKVRAVLRMRAEAGKTSTAKYDALAGLAPGGRLHYAYQYHAASTGRWSGRGAQLQNMTRDVPSAADTAGIIELTRKGDVDTIGTSYGPPISVLSRVLRPMMIARPGHILVGGDWSNVEGRGVAWFCGEEWKLEQFRRADRGAGPGVYELCAAGILGKRVEDITKQERQQYGKVPELAFGYQGGSAAAMRFGFQGTEAQAEKLKVGWRKRHPKVGAMWPALQRAAIAAVRAQNTVQAVGAPGREAHYLFDGRYLWCRLPSGRVICYPYPKILPGPYGEQMTYMTSPSANDSARGLVIDDPNNSPRWARVSAHGGLFLENIVQGFCRDFLSGLILWCEDSGFPVVLHTHDDCYVEVPFNDADKIRNAISVKMNTAPEWAAGFPLSAEVEITERYGC